MNSFWSNVRVGLLAACVSPIVALAQQFQASLSHYTTDNGLCSNAVSHIMQDDYGYIWIATWNGLSRFDGYHFYNYQTGAGSHIPNLHNRILDIRVDHQQNIWMRMYDGRVFVLKRSIDQIVNPFENVSGNEKITVLTTPTITSAGDVLLNVDMRGLYIVRANQEDQFDYSVVNTGGFQITSVAEGYQNDIWLGTDKGVHRMDASNLTVEQKGFFLDEHINCLYSNGYNVYVGTASGKIFSFSYGREPRVIRHGGTPLTSLFVDSHGVVWFSDRNAGVVRINPNSTEEKRFTQRVVVPDYDGHGAEFSEVNGIVWARLNRGGYGYYNREADEIEYFHNDPSNPWNLSNTVNARVELPEGVVWESTSRRGVDKLEILNKTIDRIQIDPNDGPSPTNEVRAMYYDGQRQQLLLANKNGTIFFMRNGEIVQTLSKDANGKSLGRIYGINMDRKGNYLVSCKDDGLYIVTPQANGFAIKNYRHSDGNEWSLNDNRVYNCVEDAEGNIWLATYGGGVNIMTKNKQGQPVFYHNKNVIRKYPFGSHTKVRTIALDRDGKVWAGTTDGVLIMSLHEGKLSIETLKPSELDPDHILLSNDVVCLMQDRQGNMWVGTNGGGIAHTIGKDANGCWLFDNFGSKDGLPSEEIRGMTYDDRGNIWFSTDHILCSYDISKGIFTTFSNLDGVDETVCSEGSAVSLPNGNVLFGTVNGYYLVDRRKLVTTAGSILKLRITDFWLNDELQSPRFNDTYKVYIPESHSFELPSHSAVFAFRFASLNYQLQHRVHYQYMLEGYDHHWQNADRFRTAIYGNLPTGHYKFKVKAFLLESPDKFDIRQIEIIVPPYFLLSSSAIWIYMLLVIVFSVRLMLWRQRILARKEKMRLLREGPRPHHLMKIVDKDFVVFLNEYLEIHFSDPMLSLDELLSAADLSEEKFIRKVYQNTGMYPKEYLLDFRIKHAAKLLENSNESISDVAFHCGFTDPSLFNRQFKAKTGMMPSKYRDLYKREVKHEVVGE